MTTRRTLNPVAPRALPFGALFLATLLLVALLGCDSGGPESTGNTLPIANAGVDRTVDVATTVTLDGSASSDADGDPLTFAWSFASTPSGSAASLSGTNTEAASFTPDMSGTYEIELTASDGTGTDTDVVVVMANAEQAIEIEGTIRSDSTLADVLADPAMVDYFVVGDVNVIDGASLTIEAGVRMAFVTNAHIEVGRGSPSALYSLGTEEEPVIMTADAESPVPGHWVGLRFWGDTHPDSRLVHTRMEYCGQDQGGCLWSYNGTFTVQDVFIIDGGSYGANLAPPGAPNGSFGPDSERLSIRRVALNLIRIAPNYVGTIPEGGTLTLNNPVLITGGTVSRTQTWPNLNLPGVGTVPYEIRDRISVVADHNPILTLLPGTELRFGDGAFLEVGRGDGGVLMAVGTEAEPIVFTSASSDPQPGDWGNDSGGIAFWSAAANGNQISHAVIEYATNLVWFSNDIGVIVTNSSLRNASDCAFRWYTSANHTTDQTPTNTFFNNTGGNQCEG